jgi:hypothetical protein
MHVSVEIELADKLKDEINDIQYDITELIQQLPTVKNKHT